MAFRRRNLDERDRRRCLDPGTHTLEWYSVDLLDHTETVRSATFEVLARFEQGDARIYYKGPWSTAASALRSGGTGSRSRAPAARSPFTGTHVRLMSSTAANMGIAVWCSTAARRKTPTSTRPLAATSSRSGRPTACRPAPTRCAWTGRGPRTPPRPAPDRHRRLRRHRRACRRHPRPHHRGERSVGWVKAAATVSLSATDTGSWVKNTYYRINGSAPTTYTAPFTVSAEGTTTVEYWSVDGAGNTESAKSTTVRIDKTRPAITDDAPADWVRGPVSVHLDSTDADSSGVAHDLLLHRRLRPLASYTGTIVISAEGTTTLRYRAIDAAGNTEATKTTRAHRRHGSGEHRRRARARWVNGPVDVTLSARPTRSRAWRHRATRSTAATRRDLHGPDHRDRRGHHTLDYAATDAAGNTETTKTATVRIDDTAPVTTSNAAGDATSETATITLSPPTPSRASQSTQYRLDERRLDERHGRRRPPRPAPHAASAARPTPWATPRPSRSPTFDVVARFEQDDARSTTRAPGHRRQRRSLRRQWIYAHGRPAARTSPSPAPRFGLMPRPPPTSASPA